MSISPKEQREVVATCAVSVHTETAAKEPRQQQECVCDAEAGGAVPKKKHHHRECLRSKEQPPPPPQLRSSSARKSWKGTELLVVSAALWIFASCVIFLVVWVVMRFGTHVAASNVRVSPSSSSSESLQQQQQNPVSIIQSEHAHRGPSPANGALAPNVPISMPLDLLQHLAAWLINPFELSKDLQLIGIESVVIEDDPNYPTAADTAPSAVSEVVFLFPSGGFFSEDRENEMGSSSKVSLEGKDGSSRGDNVRMSARQPDEQAKALGHDNPPPEAEVSPKATIQ